MGSPRDNELVAVHMSRRDLNELIEVLKKAEEVCSSMRQNEHDFRMHRVRLEVLRKSSVPPPPEPTRRASTRYVELEDLGSLGAKKGPTGDPPK